MQTVKAHMTYRNIGCQALSYTMVFVIRFNDKKKTNLETDTPEGQSKVMNTSLLYTRCNTCS